jgi:predicted RNase H-like HicB family nuclease
VPDETGGYVASIFEFPGCVAEGDSAEEAIRNLNTAAYSWVEVALANNYEFREPISFDGCSGKIALRIPRGLHKQVAELAELEGVSLNTYLVSAIAAYAGESTALSWSKKQLAKNMYAAFYIVTRRAAGFMSPDSSGYWRVSTPLSEVTYQPILRGTNLIEVTNDE